jgi:hypothetical protein
MQSVDEEAKRTCRLLEETPVHEAWTEASHLLGVEILCNSCLLQITHSLGDGCFLAKGHLYLITFPRGRRLFRTHRARVVEVNERASRNELTCANQIKMR